MNKLLIITMLIHSTVRISSAEGRLSSGPIETAIGTVLISEDVINEIGSLQGNSGRMWSVTINGVSVGQLWGHHLAMRLERSSSPDQIRIWAYIRSSGTSGRIGYYVISSNRISEYSSIEIYPGDNGTELGTTIYNAAFEDRIQFHRLAEQSATERTADVAP